LLLPSDVRLVTLTGPPGIGKTRVALAVAATLRDAFDRVAFVDLSTVTDAAEVVPAIVQTLRVKRTRQQSRLDALAETLRGRRWLLLLDNFEQVAPAAPQVAILLERCPDLKILATSRARLRLSWEHEVPVPPLGLPDLQRASDPAAVAESPAVALFLQRARSVNTDFQLTPDNAQSVAQICHRLDGLPLAIELAAPRIKLLSPQSMLARLRHRLSLLTGGGRDLPARHQTVRAAVAWSYALLEPGPQAVFRRLAVFVGGCSLAAAEAVCAESERTEGVLDALSALIDNSLLRQEELPEGEIRFSVLEIIRDYALEQLTATPEMETVPRRHALHFLALAEAAEPALAGPEQEEWLERLEREHDNLRAALRWAHQSGEAAVGLRMAGALAQFWERHGYTREGRGWLDALLAADEDGETPPPVRARALNVTGNLARVEGDYEEAVARYRESLALRQASGDVRGIAIALNNLGVAAKDRGDYPTARTNLEESLLLKRNLGDRRSIAVTLNNLGLTANGQRDHGAARVFLEESLEHFRELGDKWGIALALNNLGTTAALEGDHEEAAALHRSSLALRRGLKDKWGVAEGLEGLAKISASRGDSGRAAELFGAAEALRDQFGFPLPPDERADYDRVVAAIRARLGEGAFETAWATGRALSPEQALDEALVPDTATPSPWAAGWPPLQVRLLGHFRLVAGGQEIPDAHWGRPQAIAILQYLLMNRQRYVSADELVEIFWPEAGCVEATALYTALSRIRKGLERLPGSVAVRVTRERAGYRLLLPAGTLVDVEAFREGIRLSRGAVTENPEGTAARLTEMVGLYGGDLLADAAYGDWAAGEREALRLQFVEGKHLLGRLHESAGRWDEATRLYVETLQHEPSFEEAHRGLMRCYAVTGRRDLALKQYQTCRRILLEEIDAAPSEETEELHQSIRRGDPVRAV
jgi:predicted ATPase/DNA-binding SARP family transcriptional activator